MSDAEKDEGGSGIWICRGVNVQYLARVRYFGRRNYILLGDWTRSRRKALRELGKAFGTRHYKRGDVLMIADYYDPVPIYEVVQHER